jgi:2-polyprenyl-3-methyl-5-hydroxy-6-metoxy-1,4-benzoquinol methylase
MASPERRAGAIDVENALGVQELRMRALEHTRKAFGLLPALNGPRILDIGCGQGATTFELARLGGGEVVGIDIDEKALSRLHTRIEESGLSERVTTRRCSFLDSRLAAGSFDVLWEEGVLHLLDAAKSFEVCQRLLKPGGFLVMHERVVWFEKVRKEATAKGFALVACHHLPRRFWWTAYGAPLEARIRAFRETHGETPESPEVTRYANEVARIKADPDQTDSGFFILQK